MQIGCTTVAECGVPNLITGLAIAAKSRVANLLVSYPVAPKGGVAGLSLRFGKQRNCKASQRNDRVLGVQWQ